jgi:hypothetical protein
MLAAIWETEKKDTIELMLPFAIYAIGKTTSLGGQIDIDQVSKILSSDFGFDEIPHSVLYKIFKRLTKKTILTKKAQKHVLQKDLSETCNSVDLQLAQSKVQTDSVVAALTEYLNYRKDRIFKKDMCQEEVRNCFANFLENNGYYIYVEISKLRDTLARRNEGKSRGNSVLNYHIAQFILAEYDSNSELFSHIDNIAKGLLLSRVVYGYSDVQYNEKFKNIEIFLDTALLLNVFGFKGSEKNSAAKQLVEILHTNHVPIRCFKHNYSEVYKIVEAYRHNILDRSNRYGQTLEYFDDYKYSVADMDRVLANLEEYFRAEGIEIVNTPSLSSDGTGVIGAKDFASAIGEAELEKHLSEINYRNKEALNNDVSSISAIYTLRRGQSFKKIEQCKALFVTTNWRLAHAAQKFINDTDGSIPLLINDLDLTTLLWLKNHKRFSDLPTLKLIEVARLSLKPTEEIRKEFIKKIEQFEREPAVTKEIAAGYRQLIYTDAEKFMELIDADPENVPQIERQDLDQLLSQRYNQKLTSENEDLKFERDETKRKLWADAQEREDAAGRLVENSLKCFAGLIILALLSTGAFGLLIQEQAGNNIVFAVTTILGFIGLIDIVIPRLHLINKVIVIFANKRRAQVRKKEHLRIKKIVSPADDGRL